MSEAYFAHPGISNSAMRQIHRSPMHFIEWVKELPEASRRPHFRIGTALHYRLLENNDPEKIKIFEGTKTFQSKAGEAFLDMHHPQHICLTREELEQVEGMEKVIRADTRIMALIEAGLKEIEIYGHEITAYGKIPAKAKVDVIGPGYILDLKTTSDELHDGWKRKARDQYCIQGAWYTHMAYAHYDGIERDFYLVAIETKPPHGLRMLKMKSETLEMGRMRFENAMDLYAKCLAEGVWPGYNNDLIEEF